MLIIGSCKSADSFVIDKAILVKVLKKVRKMQSSIMSSRPVACGQAPAWELVCEDIQTKPFSALVAGLVVAGIRVVGDCEVLSCSPSCIWNMVCFSVPFDVFPYPFILPCVLSSGYASTSYGLLLP